MVELMARIEDGRPFRIAELARLIGYSREQLRKWIDAGAVQTVRAPVPTGQRRIPAAEAQRVARDLRIIP